MLTVLVFICAANAATGAENAKAPSPATYTYKTVGDCAIQADVYLPANTPKPYPVIVYLHSGALIINSRREIIPEQLNQLLAAGYAVVAADYRLAPETKLPEIVADVKDAFRWIRDKGPTQFGIDPERIGVFGRSAGSYLTLMSGVCVKPRPKVLVSFFGYGDLVGDWYTKPDPFYCSKPRVTKEDSGIRVDGPAVTDRGSNNENAGKYYLYCRQNGAWPLEVSGHDPLKDRKFFQPFCPLENVTKNYPPTMLAHGDHDEDVPYQQSVMMKMELDRNHVENELVTVPGGGHGFDNDMKNPAAQQAFAQALAFFNKHLAKKN